MWPCGDDCLRLLWFELEDSFTTNDWSFGWESNWNFVQNLQDCTSDIQEDSIYEQNRQTLHSNQLHSWEFWEAFDQVRCLLQQLSLCLRARSSRRVITSENSSSDFRHLSFPQFSRGMARLLGRDIRWMGTSHQWHASERVKWRSKHSHQGQEGCHWYCDTTLLQAFWVLQGRMHWALLQLDLEATQFTPLNLRV